MDIKRTEKHGVQILAIRGRMDLSEIVLLDEQVGNLRVEGNKWFVLNLLDVTEITSSGVGRLLNILKTLEGEQGGLALSDLSQVVEYVLDLARLSDIFPTFPNDDDAVTHLVDRRDG